MVDKIFKSFFEEALVLPETLFLNDQRQSQLPKYTNFNIDPGNLYDLVISSVEFENEGTY